MMDVTEHVTAQEAGPRLVIDVIRAEQFNPTGITMLAKADQGALFGVDRGE